MSQKRSCGVGDPVGLGLSSYMSWGSDVQRERECDGTGRRTCILFPSSGRQSGKIMQVQKLENWKFCIPSAIHKSSGYTHVRTKYAHFHEAISSDAIGENPTRRLRWLGTKLFPGKMRSLCPISKVSDQRNIPRRGVIHVALREYQIESQPIQHQPLPLDPHIYPAAHFTPFTSLNPSPSPSPSPSPLLSLKSHFPPSPPNLSSSSPPPAPPLRHTRLAKLPTALRRIPPPPS